MAKAQKKTAKKAAGHRRASAASRAAGETVANDAVKNSGRGQGTAAADAAAGEAAPEYSGGRRASFGPSPAKQSPSRSTKSRTKKAPEAETAPEEKLVARPAAIPEKQWELPAGFRQDGSFASLAEVVSDPVPTVSLESLSGQDKKKLVVERIKQQTDFPTRYMLGIGEVNKERAIAEVESDSQAGKVIQESEQKLIQMLQSAATNT